MECNKEEAIKSKTIAEKKFADKDFAGAKKFTLKSQALYPGLDGISQMLITIDVYISYEKKVNGESDWYGILNVNPSDDDETIRKHYRKLALMLHPDKNKSVGADDAFKILSEAWTLLSDKVKRFAYDLRRNPSAFQQNDSLKKEHPSADQGVNGAHPHSANKATSNPTNDSRTNSTNTTQTGPAPVTPTPASALGDHGNDTFWTICYQCNMQFEYLKRHVNHTLLCFNCHVPFLAAEMPVPMNFTFPTSQATGSYYNTNIGHSSAHYQVPMNFTIPTTEATGWGPSSYYTTNMGVPSAHFPAGQMPVPMNFTIPTAQVNGSESVQGIGSYQESSIDVNDRLKRAKSLYEDLYAQIVLNGQSSSVNNASNFFTMSPGTYSFSPGSN
ncbi:DnaJ domain-containing protein [Tanacetum coccineum]